jgi:hypothetical protein
MEKIRITRDQFDEIVRNIFNWEITLSREPNPHWNYFRISPKTLETHTGSSPSPEYSELEYYGKEGSDITLATYSSCGSISPNDCFERVYGKDGNYMENPNDSEDWMTVEDWEEYLEDAEDEGDKNKVEFLKSFKRFKLGDYCGDEDLNSIEERISGYFEIM